MNVLWKTPIHGLAHSSPTTFKPGPYGKGYASGDVSVHEWNVLCLDRATGKVLWERTAYRGVPTERHIKST